MKHSNTSWIWVLGLATAAGCTNSLDSVHTKMFDESTGDETRVGQIYKAQSDAGMREDATLQAMHFDGTDLSPAGVEKLEAVRPAQLDAKVTIYLNLPANDDNFARKQSVLAYFKTEGYDPAHVSIENGPNPNQHTPSGVGIAGLEKMNSPVETSNGASAVSAGTTAK